VELESSVEQSKTKTQNYRYSVLYTVCYLNIKYILVYCGLLLLVYLCRENRLNALESIGMITSQAIQQVRMHSCCYVAK
jgi:hypothetical protein